MISSPKVIVKKVGSLASVFDGCVSKFVRGYFRRVNRCSDQKTRIGYQYYHHFILSVPILASDFIPLRNSSSWSQFFTNQSAPDSVFSQLSWPLRHHLLVFIDPVNAAWHGNSAFPKLGYFHHAVIACFSRRKSGYLPLDGGYCWSGRGGHYHQSLFQARCHGMHFTALVPRWSGQGCP